MKRFLLLVVVISACYGNMLRNPLQELQTEQNEDYFWFTQDLDHFDMQNKQTFQQRYWVNDQYWTAGKREGPLFLYLCGEWTCSNQNSNSYVSYLAKKYNALLVVHEHRYYGMSQPKADWTTDNLKWLNTDQALADVAKFATTMSEQLAEKYKVPVKRWLVIGGSYPGALVSWFRNKYPHIAFGAWSSSGVVEAIQDFHQFDETVTEALTKSSDKCAKTVRKLIEYTDKEFEQERGNAIKKVYNSTNLRDDDFFWFYSDAIAEAVQYGDRSELCERVDKLGEDYPAMNKMINDWQVGKFVRRDDYDSTSALQNTTIDFSKNARQWTYQYCSQLGYLQTPAKKYPPLKNKSMDLDFWKGYCTRAFGRETYPDTKLWNLRYGGKKPAISKVIYMNGDEDPWKPSGITESKNIFIHAFPLMCDNCAHCVDLRSPVENAPKEVDIARKKAEKIIGRWIQFEKKYETENVSVEEREFSIAEQFIK